MQISLKSVFEGPIKISRYWFGFAQIKRQAFTWTNVDYDFRHHMAPLDRNKPLHE